MAERRRAPRPSSSPTPKARALHLPDLRTRAAGLRAAVARPLPRRRAAAGRLGRAGAARAPLYARAGGARCSSDFDVLLAPATPCAAHADRHRVARARRPAPAAAAQHGPADPADLVHRPAGVRRAGVARRHASAADRRAGHRRALARGPGAARGRRARGRRRRAARPSPHWPTTDEPLPRSTCPTCCAEVDAPSSRATKTRWSTTTSTCSTSCSGQPAHRALRRDREPLRLRRDPRLPRRRGRRRAWRASCCAPSSPPTAATSPPPTTEFRRDGSAADRPPEPDLGAHRPGLARGRRAREPARTTGVTSRCWRWPPRDDAGDVRTWPSMSYAPAEGGDCTTSSWCRATDSPRPSSAPRLGSQPHAGARGAVPAAQRGLPRASNRSSAGSCGRSTSPSSSSSTTCVCMLELASVARLCTRTDTVPRTRRAEGDLAGAGGRAHGRSARGAALATSSSTPRLRRTASCTPADPSSALLMIRPLRLRRHPAVEAARQSSRLPQVPGRARCRRHARRLQRRLRRRAEADRPSASSTSARATTTATTRRTPQARGRAQEDARRQGGRGGERARDRRRAEDDGEHDRPRRRDAAVPDLVRLLRPAHPDDGAEVPGRPLPALRRPVDRGQAPEERRQLLRLHRRGQYLNGIVAGHTSKSKKLGFVAAKPIPQVLRNINAFTLGARSVNPTITTQVIFTGDWSMPVKEAEATNSLVDQGVDVAHHATSTARRWWSRPRRGAARWSAATTPTRRRWRPRPT